MTNDEFRAFLDLLMCSDPWPVAPDTGKTHDVLVALADKESLERGHTSWIVAYHEHLEPYEDKDGGSSQFGVGA